MAEALRDGYARGLFVSIQHPSGTGYFCTGIGSRSWNGQTWTGTGKLGSISSVKQSSEIAVQDISFRMSGVNAEIVAQLNDNVRNLNGSVWLACFDTNDKVVSEPYRLVDSELDYQLFDVQADGSAIIEIVAHAGFYTLDRAIEEAWTPEAHNLVYPTDIGLDQIPPLQHQDLQWTAS